MAMAPPHCLKLYNVPAGSRQETSNGDGATLGTKASAWFHEIPGNSAGPQTGQFGRSEAEAKLHRLDWDPEDHSELRSNSRAQPRDLGPRAACSATITSGVSLRCDFDFVGAGGPKCSCSLYS